jgi:hypothetical protein
MILVFQIRNSPVSDAVLASGHSSRQKNQASSHTGFNRGGIVEFIISL